MRKSGGKTAIAHKVLYDVGIEAGIVYVCPASLMVRGMGGGICDECLSNAYPDCVIASGSQVQNTKQRKTRPHIIAGELDSGWIPITMGCDLIGLETSLHSSSGPLHNLDCCLFLSGLRAPCFTANLGSSWSLERNRACCLTIPLPIIEPCFGRRMLALLPSNLVQGSDIVDVPGNIITADARLLKGCNASIPIPDFSVVKPFRGLDSTSLPIPRFSHIRRERRSRAPSIAVNTNFRASTECMQPSCPCTMHPPTSELMLVYDLTPYHRHPSYVRL